jgi:hypothetical protein
MIRFGQKHVQQVARAARIETGLYRKTIEAGERIRIDKRTQFYAGPDINFALLTDDFHLEGTDLHDKFALKELVGMDIDADDKGRVWIDFYIYKIDEELESNVTLEWTNGHLTRVRGTEKGDINPDIVRGRGP